jgi:large subunit ribosomal protein L21
MYAVIKTGGKQHRVSAGDVIEIEKIHGGTGDTVFFDEVLLVSGDERRESGYPICDRGKGKR